MKKLSLGLLLSLSCIVHAVPVKNSLYTIAYKGVGSSIKSISTDDLKVLLTTFITAEDNDKAEEILNRLLSGCAEDLMKEWLKESLLIEQDTTKKVVNENELTKEEKEEREKIRALISQGYIGLAVYRLTYEEGLKRSLSIVNTMQTPDEREGHFEKEIEVLGALL